MRRVLTCGSLLAAMAVAVPAGPAHAQALRISVFGDSVLLGVPKEISALSQSAFADGRAAMNTELTAAVSRHADLEVVDWAGAVAARPDLVYGDGIHLTPAGQHAMADMARTRVDDDGKGDGGWLVAGFAAIALGAGAVVAWRACRRTDVPE
jgi:hypothetical protein